jgi:putative transposase
MPFASGRRHEYWSTDVRYVDHRLPSDDNVYVISILENHSRALLLASAITRSQDSGAFLSVLYEAIKRYGSPEALVTDGEARSSGPTELWPSTRSSPSARKR